LSDGAPPFIPAKAGIQDHLLGLPVSLQPWVPRLSPRKRGFAGTNRDWADAVGTRYDSALLLRLMSARCARL
jgi:hypothetical protein